MEKNAFIGFGGVNPSDCTVNTSTDVIHYESAAGTVNNLTALNCASYGGTWDQVNATCTGASLAAFKWQGGSPNACALGADAFKMGASAEAAGTIKGASSKSFIQISDGGKIEEKQNASDCF